MSGIVAGDIKQKRSTCQNALLVNKQKGTLKSLKEALSALNLNTTVILNGGKMEALQKGTAEINLHEKDIIYGEEQFKSILRLIEEVKRLALHISIKKTSSLKGSMYIGGSINVINRVYI